MIAGKASVVRVQCLSMEDRTDQKTLITTCQLHMRSFKDGDTIVVEPWRAKAFPVIKDLTVDRTAFDRVIAAGGFISVNTGNAQDANNLPIPKNQADAAFEAAACIGCGACVATCKNASAMFLYLQKSLSWHNCRKDSQNVTAVYRAWLPKWMPKDLVIVPIQELARQNALKESLLKTLPE